MRKKILYLSLVWGIVSLFLGLVVYIFTDSCWQVLFPLWFLFSCIPLVFFFLNQKIKCTNWYKFRFGSVLKFYKPIPFGLDIVNLGSSSGNYAFNYEGTGVAGRNWAVRPQTLWYDFQVLKNYFSFIKKGGIVLIPLCPFSFCIKNFTEICFDDKYHLFLHPILITHFSKSTRARQERLMKFPFLMHPTSLIRLVSDIADYSEDLRNPMTAMQLSEDARARVKEWKLQFNITDLENPLSQPVKEAMEYNCEILRQMFAFCYERELHPVLILPPASKVLKDKFPDSFREQYVYANVRKVITGTDIPFMDYWDDRRFDDREFYFNSFFLNAVGRKLFTEQVLRDLKLIGER